MIRRLLCLAALAPTLAWGGGFDIPDNGTQALGRGGAFVAKADDGLAIAHNVAGFGRQKGTRVTLDNNLHLHAGEFTRAGVYPGVAGDPRMPYAGTAYPTIRDRESIFYAPSFAISTDLGGRLKNFTLALGIYGPSSVGRHNYGVGPEVCQEVKGDDEKLKRVCDDPPATVNGKADGLPAPSRYDISRTDLLIAYPTLAVAWQPDPAIEVGFGWQMVLAHFDLANANLTPLGGNCPVPDYAGCDTYGRVRTFGTSFSSSSKDFDKTPVKFNPGITSFGWLFGLMLHPTTWFDVGWSFRPQIDVRTEGTLHPVPPPGQMIGDVPAVFSATIPASMRLGFRAVKRFPDGTERADLELDLTWENWEAERGSRLYATGDKLYVAKDNTLDAMIVHNYKDTFGLRLGGAYSFRLAELVRLTLRAGGYVDTAATRSAETRLDFNTLDKFAGTVGAGFKWKGFGVNLAYAFVYSPVRTVKDSAINAISAVNGTNLGPGDPFIAVGNGKYVMQNHILSVGLTINFSEFKRPQLMAN